MNITYQKNPKKVKSLTGMNMDGVNEVCHHVPVIFVLFDGIFHSSSELYSAPDFNPGWGGFGLAHFYLKINIFNFIPVI